MDLEKGTKIILIGFNSDYQRLEVAELSHYYDVVHLKMNRVIYALISKLAHRAIVQSIVPLYYNFAFKRIALGNHCVIITDDPVDIYSCKIFETERIRILMRNSIFDNRFFIELSKKYLVYSFDPLDVEKFHLRSMNQYIPKSNCASIVRPSTLNTDFFFLGLDKGRHEILHSLRHKLDGFGFVSDFIVKSPPHGILQKIKKWLLNDPTHRMVSYEMNLKMVAQSRCIVEIMQRGQSGITLRTLESIFYGKKLLTNNKYILDSELYDKANMFYFERVEDIDEGALLDFMSSEFVKYPRSILEKYEVYYNFNRIICGMD